MDKNTNIYLVGLMGAGKTTVGRQLARRLGRRFYDSDHEIVARTGVPIPTIFEIEGETGFRRRESQTIAELSELRGIVMATGGGAVLDPDNRRCLAGRGFVVYLCAAVDEQLRRTRGDDSRPLLQTADPRARLAQLFAQRDPLYRNIADLIVVSDGQTLRAIVQQILDRLAPDAAWHR